MTLVVHEIETNKNGQAQVEIELDEGTENKLWIELPKKELLIWSVILFIAQVGLYKNRRRLDAPKTYLQLLKRLDLSFLEEVADDYYKTHRTRYTYTLQSWVLFLFLCSFFDMNQKEMLKFLKNPAHRAWRHLIGWRNVPDEARVSEFKKRFGNQRLTWALCQLRDQIYALVYADELREEDLVNYARRRTINSNKSYIGRVGFNLFCHFIDGLGILAELVGCLEMAPNASYRPQDLILALVHRVITEAKNLTQLADKLQNARGRGELELAPSRVSLGQAFARLDSDRLEKLNQRLMKRALLRNSNLRVGIDSSLLEVYGQYEESAETVNPHTKQKVKAYKLFAAVDMVNKEVLYLKLTEGNTADSTELLSAAKAVQRLAAPHPVELILFDKGFYKQASFNELTQGEKREESQQEEEFNEQEEINQAPAQPFITPAKKYKTIKEAVQSIEDEEYLPYEPILTDSQQKKRECERPETKRRREKQQQELEEAKGGPAVIAEKLIEVSDYKGKLRLIVIKDKRKRKKYIKNGRYYLKDEAGNRLFHEEWEVFYHAYLTNVLASQMSGSQVVTAYKGRWRVEDLFEEWKNDWGLKYFPSTDGPTVKAHLWMICILYTSLNFFKRLCLQGKYARQMLNTLQSKVLQAPHKRYEKQLLKWKGLTDKLDYVEENILILFKLGHWRVQQYHLRPLF